MSTPSPVRVRTSVYGDAGRIAVLGALVALGPLSIDFYLPALADDLAATPSAAQLTITACLVGLAAGQVLAGPLSDVLGRRAPLLGGLVGYVAASLLCAVAPNAPSLVALRTLQGTAGAIGIVVANAIVRDLYSGARAARVFSLLLLVTGLGPVLAPVLGGQLLRVAPWRGGFVALAAVGAVLAVAVALRLPETLPPAGRRRGGCVTGQAFARLLTDRAYIGYAAAGGLAFGAMFAYIAGSPFVLQTVHGLSPQAYSAVFAVNALGLVAAAQVSGRVVHRTGPRRLLALGLVASAVGGLGTLVAAVAVPVLAALLSALFLVVAGMGLVMPNAIALALDRHDDIAGAASGLVGLAQFLIGAAAAPLVGLSGAATAVPMGIVTAVLGTASLLVFLVTLQRSWP